MRFALFLLVASLAVTPAIAQPIRFASPNGKLRASVFVDSAQHLAWSLFLNGKPLVMAGGLGITLSGTDVGAGVKLGTAAVSLHNSSYPWSGVHSVATDRYRRVMIPIIAKHGRFTLGGRYTLDGPFTLGGRFTLECRLFDDGFAFRYLIHSHGSVRVTGESSSWHLPAGSTVWYQENVYYYEGLHYASPISRLGVKQMGPPVTFRTPDGLYGSITEAALYNYSGMSLKSDTLGTLRAAFVNDPDGWTMDGTFSSPWRVVLASATLDGLVNSDVIPDLNPAPDSAARASAPWIRPGRAVWSYFDHDNVTTLALEKAYVDKAGALGFEYSIVDAGWDSSWPNAYDSLASLVRFASRRHVGIFVWKSYASLKDDSVRQAFFRDMQRLGVAGLKIDYIDKEGIDQVRFYEKALRDGLAFHLLIDFHGADKPTGYNRRFPNELTREGIYGQEWRTYTPQGPINNAIIPFTRFLAGPADYTPGVFDSKLSYGTSRAQQLALTVIYNSPLLCWADDPAVYLASPAAGLVRTIPTTWDETRVLPFSRIGELVAFARRKGNDWFVGIINAGDEKRLALPLSFLGSGGFRAEIISDDLTSADRVLRSVAGVGSGDTLPVLLNSKGGFVARFTATGTPPAQLAIRPAGGYLLGPQRVRIETKSPAVIRYTTDGSLPDTRSALYTGDFTVYEPGVVRARVFEGTGAGARGATAKRGATDVAAEGADVVAQFLRAPAPEASPAGGIFIGRQAVCLSTGVPGEIRYTTDGSEPGASSPLYQDSVLLDTSTMLKSRVFFAAGGASEINNVRFQKVVPDEAVFNGGDGSGSGAATGGIAGLRYSYYEGKWDSMPAFERLTEKKHGVVLFPSLDSITSRPNEYGLRFSGWIKIPETGVYTFYTISDDGSQLYIGDQKVVDNDGCHGDLERCGDRALMAGKHPFVLDYFQNSSGQTLQIFIKGPHLTKQMIPAAMYSAQ